jgi:hypothetical protein
MATFLAGRAEETPIRMAKWPTVARKCMVIQDAGNKMLDREEARICD